mmetsp:Transcript_35478/g.93633  ORF Transcript_35478/g.93633 Transcript_35478/m.93633 type:complete len:437 (+) Transcript_35478:494-1804(+)
MLGHGQLELRGGNSGPRVVHALTNLRLFRQQVVHLLLLLPHQLPPLGVQRQDHQHAPERLLDQRRCAVAVLHPLPGDGSLEEALRRDGAVDEPPAAPVPVPSPVAVLNPRGRVVHLHDLQPRAQAAPEPLDADRRRDSLALDAARLEVPVPLLQRDRRPVVLHAQHQPSEDHMVQHNREHERRVVMLLPVGELEKPIRDRHVAALPHALPLLILVLAPAHRARRAHRLLSAPLLLQHRLDDVVLVGHEVADLLHDPQQRRAVEVRQDAALALAELLLLLRPRVRLRLRLRRLLRRRLVAALLRGVRGLLLLLGGAAAALGGGTFFPRGPLLRLEAGAVRVGLQLAHVRARLRRQRRHGAVDLRPIQWQPVVHLASKDLHELGACTGVHALEPQVVVRGEARGVERLAHRDEDLGGQEDVPVMRREAFQEQARQALL